MKKVLAVLFILCSGSMLYAGLPFTTPIQSSSPTAKITIYQDGDIPFQSVVIDTPTWSLMTSLIGQTTNNFRAGQNIGNVSFVAIDTNTWSLLQSQITLFQSLLGETTNNFRVGQMIGNNWFSVSGSSVSIPGGVNVGNFPSKYDVSLSTVYVLQKDNFIVSIASFPSVQYIQFESYPVAIPVDLQGRTTDTLCTQSGTWFVSVASGHPTNVSGSNIYVASGNVIITNSDIQVRSTHSFNINGVISVSSFPPVQKIEGVVSVSSFPTLMTVSTSTIVSGVVALSSVPPVAVYTTSALAVHSTSVFYIQFESYPVALPVDLQGRTTSVLTIDYNYDGRASTQTIGMFSGGSGTISPDFSVKTYNFIFVGSTGTWSTNIGSGTGSLITGMSINEELAIPKNNSNFLYNLAHDSSFYYIIKGVK